MMTEYYYSQLEQSYYITGLHSCDHCGKILDVVSVIRIGQNNKHICMRYLCNTHGDKKNRDAFHLREQIFVALVVQDHEELPADVHLVNPFLGAKPVRGLSLVEAAVIPTLEGEVVDNTLLAGRDQSRLLPPKRTFAELTEDPLEMLEWHGGENK